MRNHFVAAFSDCSSSRIITVACLTDSIVDENGVVSNKNIPVDLNGFNPDKLTVSEYFSYSHVFYPLLETELIEATDLI